VGLGAWAAGRALVGGESAQLPNLAAVVGIGVVGAALVVAGYRLTRVRAALTERTPVPPAEGAAVGVPA
jgi:phosphoribosylaminoimidazole (AIR) synthetase